MHQARRTPREPSRPPAERTPRCSCRVARYRVIAFDGTGQGGALEDHGLPLTPCWERPVSAVLDHYGIASGVTAIGISLGGGPVIRAAGFEPRIRQAVAFDVLDDELEVVARQAAGDPLSAVALPAFRALLASRARPLLDAIAREASARKPVAAWGLQQGLHITGTSSPYDFLQAARAVQTRDISHRVTCDVLLLAGADDHYVPLHQLHRQAASLTHARSVTTRTFTAAEQASNHCQIGNIGLGIRTILAWASAMETRAGW